MKIKNFQFLNDKMLQIAKLRFDLFWGHLIWDVINSKAHILIGHNSQMPDRVQFRFRSPNDQVYIRWSAFEKWILLMQKLIFFKISEISGFETFISDGFISSRKCPILKVDPALNSLDSELFNALFDVITALCPTDLSTD